MTAALNLRERVDVPCYYCDGEGGGYEQTDVDAWDRLVVCDECGGSGISSRKAGGRYTGYPRHVDQLTTMRDLRAIYLATRKLAAAVKAGDEAYAESCKAHAAGDYAAAEAAFAVWSEADKRKQRHLAEHRTVDVSECWHRYEIARLRAMRPVSRIAQAEMLALADRAERRWEELKAAMRSAA